MSTCVKFWSVSSGRNDNDAAPSQPVQRRQPLSTAHEFRTHELPIFNIMANSKRTFEVFDEAMQHAEDDERGFQDRRDALAMAVDAIHKEAQVLRQDKADHEKATSHDTLVTGLSRVDAALDSFTMCLDGLDTNVTAATTGMQEEGEAQKQRLVHEASKVQTALVALQSEVDKLPNQVSDFGTQVRSQFAVQADSAAQTDRALSDMRTALTELLCGVSTDLAAKVDGLDPILTTLSQSLSQIRGKVDGLDRAISQSVTHMMLDIEPSLTAFSGSLEQLDGRLASLGHTVSTDVGATLTTINAAVAAFPKDLRQLGAELTEAVDGPMRNFQPTLTSLEGKMDGLASSLNQFQATLQSLSEVSTDLGTKLDRLDESASRTETSVSNKIEDVMTVSEAAITAEIESRAANLASKLDSIETSIAQRLDDNDEAVLEGRQESAAWLSLIRDSVTRVGDFLYSKLPGIEQKVDDVKSVTITSHASVLEGLATVREGLVALQDNLQPEPEIVDMVNDHFKCVTRRIDSLKSSLETSQSSAHTQLRGDLEEAVQYSMREEMNRFMSTHARENDAYVADLKHKLAEERRQNRANLANYESAHQQRTRAESKVKILEGKLKAFETPPGSKNNPSSQ